MHRAAGVHEAEAVAFELLHDEPFAAEQADAELALEGDADRDALGRAEERVLLADQLPAELLQIHRQDLAGIRRRERDLLLAAARLVKTVMNRLSPVISRLPAPSSASITPPRFCWLPSPNTVSIAMPGVMYIIDARFSDRALAWIQFDLDELHLAAEDPEVDLVRPPARHDRRRRRAAARREPPAEVGRELRHVLERRPVRHARGEHQRVAVDRAVPQVRHHVVLRHRSDLMAADGHVPLLLRHSVFGPVTRT